MADQNLSERLRVAKEFEARFQGYPRFMNDDPLPHSVLDAVARLPEREQKAFEILQAVNYQLTNLIIIDGVSCDYDLGRALQPAIVEIPCRHLKKVEESYMPHPEFPDDCVFDAEFAISFEISNLIKRLTFAVDVANMEDYGELSRLCHSRKWSYSWVCQTTLAQQIFDIILDLRRLIFTLVLGKNLNELHSERLSNFMGGAYHDIYNSQRMSLDTTGELNFPKSSAENAAEAQGMK